MPADNEKIPLDKAVRTGKLPNGFTYYIRRNLKPEGRVSLYLANKVGAIQEDEDQLGAAHFLEHMNFNGTVNFPKNELVDYLQKIGVSFGADLNAMTTFDATIYQLPIPTDNPEFIKKGLTIMHDWAQGASLETDEINAERGIILEEMRSRDNVMQRTMMQYTPVVLNQSKYASRWPIGTEESIKKMTPEAIRRFHHDWYRPNLQALVVVGDINVDEMEKQIRKQFSDLKNPVNERSAEVDKVKLAGKNNFISITDKEADGTMIMVVVKTPEIVVRTIADYKETFKRQIFNDIMSDRYNVVSLNDNLQFIGATVNISPFLGKIDLLSGMVALKPGQYEDGFKAMWREHEIAKRFGFTENEIKTSKKSILDGLALALIEKSNAQSSGYVDEYVRVFLTDEAAAGIVKENEISIAAVNEITQADMHEFIKRMMSDTNRDIIITSAEKYKDVLPNQAAVESWMQEVAKEDLKPYNDKKDNRPLMAKKPSPGKVKSTKSIASLSITELTLSNGLKVILKPTKYRNDQIVINGFGPGGTSIYSDADFESAANATELISGAGVGEFSKIDISKISMANQMGINPIIDENYQELMGSCITSSLEKQLQLIHLYMAKPKLDTNYYANWVDRTKAELAEPSNSPQSSSNDTIISVFHNYNPRFKTATIEDLKKININRAFEIYKERFGNARNFTFVIIGSFNPKTITPLLETYLGSLPSLPNKDSIVNLNIHPAPGKITKMVYKGNGNLSNVTMIFSGKYSYGVKNNMQLIALKSILDYKLTERLREIESGVYSPSVSVNYSKIPNNDYSVFISFSCSPDNYERLIAATLDEVKKLKDNGALLTDIEKFHEESMRHHQIMLKENYFWMSYITRSYKNGDNLENILEYEKNIKNIQANNIKEAANTFLSGDNLIKVILLPENYATKSNK
ncbi:MULTISPECIES: M16 family metallopeptidase [unclassified Flavobacterium]|uniref:M16 family metallopeptidase n=1 Tax=unclassified Flavobacterium TaxID=196869 RepID=UPI001F429A7E|nr:MULTISPECIES: M16 family metallopeptidase [unclassified Flavobacterium]